MMVSLVTMYAMGTVSLRRLMARYMRDTGRRIDHMGRVSKNFIYQNIKVTLKMAQSIGLDVYVQIVNKCMKDIGWMTSLTGMESKHLKTGQYILVNSIMG